MNGWDVDPNLYASPYRALVEWARELLKSEAGEGERAQPSEVAGCRC